MATIEDYEITPAVAEINSVIFNAHKKRNLVFLRAFGQENYKGKTDADLKALITGIKTSAVNSAKALDATSDLTTLANTFAEQAALLQKVHAAREELHKWQTEIAGLVTKYGDVLTAIDTAATDNPNDANLQAQKAAKDRLVTSAVNLRTRMAATKTAVDTA